MVNKKAIDVWLAQEGKNYVWLSLETGLSYKGLHSIVHGKTLPDGKSIQAIQRATKLSYDSFLVPAA